MDTVQEITRQLSTPPLSNLLKEKLGKRIRVRPNKMTCLKETSRSSIWMLDFNKNFRRITWILKIYHSPSIKNKKEINFLKLRLPEIKPLLPDVYWIGSPTNNDDTWILMEYVQQVRGQITMHPDYFAKIIPSIAELHAKTFQGSSTYKNITQLLPPYQSAEMFMERKQSVDKTISYLDRAMKQEHLRKIIQPYYKKTLAILKKGPDFFPELIAEGECVIHGDLHMQNVCCNNISKKHWHIQLIDWETARCSPGWIDLAVLVEVLLDFRKDWQKDAEKIRYECVQLYTEELRKHGITFQTDPMKLYKMAYLQRTLEKGLYTHLKRELQGRPGVLLETYLRKITTWGEELHMFN